MKIKPPEVAEITELEKSDLVKSLNDFDKWLVKKQVVTTPSTISYVNLPFANADWTMTVVDNEVSFNTFVRNKCSAKYYKSIVLHEFFHLAVQKVPHKDDAVKIKDDFGNEMMKLIDIEADFFTALFHKEVLKYGLVDYLRLYYEGGKVFADKWIRIGKLERFIGTLLSISRMFLDHPNKRDKVFCCDLYLPCVAPLSMDDKMHVLVIRKEHIYFDYINSTNKDFVAMKECYSSLSILSFKEYAQKIIEFCCHALDRDIPKSIVSQIKKITD